jgi:cytosolic 5'-nucleotidase 3
MDIHAPNKQILDNKITALKTAGLSCLHIIADFDRTLTTARVEGEDSTSSFAQIRNGGYLSETYVAEAKRLYSVYYPIEIDPKVPLEEKAEKMQEWWHLHMELMLQHGMNRAVLDDIVMKGKVQGRAGLRELLTFSAEKKIPFLIFSAGLGDLIKTYLKHEGIYFDNVHVISNLFKFNDQGLVTGIEDKMITALNKSEVAISNTPFAKEIESKPNVILLGDSLSDTGMTADLKHATILKIGFLNDHHDLLSEFEKEFDLILLNDGDISYVTELLEQISAGG